MQVFLNDLYSVVKVFSNDDVSISSNVYSPWVIDLSRQTNLDIATCKLPYKLTNHREDLHSVVTAVTHNHLAHAPVDCDTSGVLELAFFITIATKLPHVAPGMVKDLNTVVKDVRDHDVVIICAGDVSWFVELGNVVTFGAKFENEFPSRGENEDTVVESVAYDHPGL